MIVWLVPSLGALAVAWLSAGRDLTLLIDRVTTVRKVSLPVNRLAYDGGGFVVGGQFLTFGLTNNLRADLQLTSDSSNRVILSDGPNAFILGPRTGPPDPSGRPDFGFVPEPADKVVLTCSESLVSWRAPFQFNIFGGESPRWKRYAYYRLVWEKPSGAELKMLWRYERQYYSESGWTAPAMMWNSQTGLLSVGIQPESRGPEGAIVRYIAHTKGWNRSEYWIERRGPSPDGAQRHVCVSSSVRPVRRDARRRDVCRVACRSPHTRGHSGAWWAVGHSFAFSRRCCLAASSTLRRHITLQLREKLKSLKSRSVISSRNAIPGTCLDQLD
jgi:hypothetical protein